MWATSARAGRGQDGLGDLVADAHHGIERGHRLLKDHGHARAAQLLQVGGAGRAEVAALELHLAGEPCLGRQQPHDRQCGDAFAGAGFTNQGEGLSAVERERDAVHGSHRPTCGRKLDGEIAKL